MYVYTPNLDVQTLKYVLAQFEKEYVDYVMYEKFAKERGDHLAAEFYRGKVQATESAKIYISGRIHDEFDKLEGRLPANKFINRVTLEIEDVGNPDEVLDEFVASMEEN